MKNRILKSFLLVFVISAMALCSLTLTAFATEAPTSGSVDYGGSSTTSTTYTWSYDADTQCLTVTVTNPNWNENVASALISDDNFVKFRSAYGNDVKVLCISGYHKINCKFSSLRLPYIERISLSSESLNNNCELGFVSGMTKLKYFEFGSGKTATCIDLSKMTGGNSNRESFLDSMFKGCLSAEKVVFPTTPFQLSVWNSSTQKRDYYSYYAIAKNMFYGCSSLSEVELPAWLTEIKEGAFEGCTSLKSITIPASVTTIHSTAFERTGIEKYILLGTDVSTLLGYKLPTDKAIVVMNSDLVDAFKSNGYKNVTLYSDPLYSGSVSNCSAAGSTNGTNTVSWSFAPETGTLDIWGSYSTVELSENSTFLQNENFIAFASAFGANVKTVNFFHGKTSVTNISSTDGNGFNLLANLGINNIEEIYVSEGTELNGVGNLFIGLSNLSRFGVSGTAASTVDMSGISLAGADSITLFSTQTAVTRIKLSNDHTNIGANAFDGMTALKEIVFADGISKVGANAFNGCTSLKRIVIPAGATAENIFDAAAFTGSSVEKVFAMNTSSDVISGYSLPSDMTVCVVSQEIADALVAAGMNAVYGDSNVYYSSDVLPEGFNRSMKHIGFQVRTSSYNGLRNLFVHDNDTVNAGYSIKEYGSFLISEENYGNLSIEYDGNTVVFGDKAQNIAIYKDGRTVGKILTGISDPDVANGTYFAYSVVRYSEVKHISAALYAAAYELWVNDTTGDAVIIVTDYSVTSGNNEHNNMSYYDVALGMYKSGVINSRNDEIAYADMVKAGCVASGTGSVNYDVFSDKEKYTLIYRKGSDSVIPAVASGNCLDIDSAIFNNIACVVMDSGITGAGDNAFAGLSSEKYTLPSSFTTLNGSAFENATGIKNIDLTGIEREGTLKFGEGESVFVRLDDDTVEGDIPMDSTLENVIFLVGNRAYVPAGQTAKGLDEIKYDTSKTILFNEGGVWLENTCELDEWTSESKVGYDMKAIKESAFSITTTDENEVTTVSGVKAEGMIPGDWEIRVYGRTTDEVTSFNVTVGGETVYSFNLESGLRCYKPTFGTATAGEANRYTARKNFTYCDTNAVVYISDYVSIDSEGTVAVYRYNVPVQGYNTKIYPVVSYNKTVIGKISGILLDSETLVSNSESLQTELIYTTEILDTKKVEAEVAASITAGLGGVSRNVYISSDGTQAWYCVNGGTFDNVSGAYLLEINGIDTNNPTVGRYVLLNDMGHCSEVIPELLEKYPDFAALIDEKMAANGKLQGAHLDNCSGRILREYRACTGAVDNGRYIYAVERYTGPFDHTISYGGDNGSHAHMISTLSVIDKETFTVVGGPVFLQSNACSVEISPIDGKLYVCEMYGWSVFDISGENETAPKLLHKQPMGGLVGESQRSTYWTDKDGRNFVAFSAWGAGVHIWDVTGVSEEVAPTLVGVLRLDGYNGCPDGQRQVFDLTASYPYLYITVGSLVYSRFSTGNLPDCILTVDISDSSTFTKGAFYEGYKYVVTPIPYEERAGHLDEGDPAPSRILLIGDVLMTNYSENGVAFFRIINGVPYFDHCEILTNGIPQTIKKLPGTNKVVIVNGEGFGSAAGLYIYEIKNLSGSGDFEEGDNEFPSDIIIG